ncbi:MAG: hypothetical protein ACOVMP_06030, partial [Chthoniobacterales bacterium]
AALGAATLTGAAGAVSADLVFSFGAGFFAGAGAAGNSTLAALGAGWAAFGFASFVPFGLLAGFDFLDFGMFPRFVVI